MVGWRYNELNEEMLLEAMTRPLLDTYTVVDANYLGKQRKKEEGMEVTGVGRGKTVKDAREDARLQMFTLTQADLMGVFTWEQASIVYSDFHVMGENPRIEGVEQPFTYKG